VQVYDYRDAFERAEMLQARLTEIQTNQSAQTALEYTAKRRTEDDLLEADFRGTPPEMGPEQSQGELLDKRTDTWLFSGALYEMLAEKPAFAVSRWQIFWRQQNAGIKRGGRVATCRFPLYAGSSMQAGERVGPYEILSCIGEGGMGARYGDILSAVIRPISARLGTTL
jgi:hypothetical protein